MRLREDHRGVPCPDTHELALEGRGAPTLSFIPADAEQGARGNATLVDNVDRRPLRVLVLDEEVPYPLNSGKRIRTWNLLSRLARRHSIHLVCFGDGDSPTAELNGNNIQVHLVPPLRDFKGWQLYARLALNAISVYPYSVTKHYSRRFLRQAQELLRENKFDLIHCEWTPYARYLDKLAGVPTFVSTHNIESKVWSRRAQNSRDVSEKFFFGMQARKMERFERQTLLKAGGVTAVSPVDLEQMRQWGIVTASLAENGVDLEQFRPAPDPSYPNELLFVGSLDWFPNQDAIRHLLEDIMPAVHSQRPATTLCLIGRRPPEQVRQMVAGLSWVNLVGEVEDVRPYLNRAALVVVPLRIGGGSRLKILEALAAGKAVVSTSIGAEGLSVTNGENIMIADRPADFANAVCELLTSEEKRTCLGRAGRALVVQCYSWDRIVKNLEAAWYRACGLACQGRQQTSNP